MCMKYVCLHTHSFSLTQDSCLYTLPWIWSPYTGIQTRSGIQTRPHYTQWSAHTKTHPCTLTYIITKVLVCEIPFQKTKLIVKRKKNPEHRELHRCKRIPTHTLWSLPIRIPTRTTAIAAQHLLDMLPWMQTSGEPQRFQAHTSMATYQTNPCQVSTSSLTDHNENYPLGPRVARSKILPQTSFSF